MRHENCLFPAPVQLRIRHLPTPPLAVFCKYVASTRKTTMPAHRVKTGAHQHHYQPTHRTSVNLKTTASKCANDEHTISQHPLKSPSASTFPAHNSPASTASTPHNHSVSNLPTTRPIALPAPPAHRIITLSATCQLHDLPPPQNSPVKLLESPFCQHRA
jgi:hypothetical protein